MACNQSLGRQWTENEASNMYETGTHKQCASFRNTIFGIPSGPTDTLDFSDNSVYVHFQQKNLLNL